MSDFEKWKTSVFIFGVTEKTIDYLVKQEITFKLLKSLEDADVDSMALTIGQKTSLNVSQ